MGLFSKFSIKCYSDNSYSLCFLFFQLCEDHISLLLPYRHKSVPKSDRLQKPPVSIIFTYTHALFNCYIPFLYKMIQAAAHLRVLVYDCGTSALELCSFVSDFWTSRKKQLSTIYCTAKIFFNGHCRECNQLQKLQFDEFQQRGLANVSYLLLSSDPK